MTPTTRKELALMVPNGGTVIELGVAAGLFAEDLLTTNPQIRYIGVDRWSDHHDAKEMGSAIARISAVSDNFETVRATFRDYLPSVQYESIDMIYVDGYAHTGQEGGETLNDWWPRVKPGGIFAGHDYCQEYHQTQKVVDSFVATHGLELHIIDEKPHPSWWVRKPA